MPTNNLFTPFVIVLEWMYFAYNVLALFVILYLIVAIIQDPSGSIAAAFAIPFLLVAAVVNPVLVMRNVRRMRLSQIGSRDRTMSLVRILLYSLTAAPLYAYVLLVMVPFLAS